MRTGGRHGATWEGGDGPTPTALHPPEHPGVLQARPDRLPCNQTLEVSQPQGQTQTSQVIQEEAGLERKQEVRTAKNPVAGETLYPAAR